MPESIACRFWNSVIGFAGPSSFFLPLPGAAAFGGGGALALALGGGGPDCTLPMGGDSFVTVFFSFAPPCTANGNTRDN